MSLSPVRGRLKVLPPGATQSRNRRESVLVRAVSIVESYVSDQLVVRLAPLAPVPRSALVENLYGQFEDKGTASWIELDNYFKKYVHSSVRIKTYTSWSNVNAAIEARNAVVHGLGWFTARQQRKNLHQTNKSALQALKFDLTDSDTRVHVTPDAIEGTVALLRDYLEWLDNLLTTHSPL